VALWHARGPTPLPGTVALADPYRFENGSATGDAQVRSVASSGDGRT